MWVTHGAGCGVEDSEWSVSFRALRVEFDRFAVSSVGLCQSGNTRNRFASLNCWPAVDRFFPDSCSSESRLSSMERASAKSLRLKPIDGLGLLQARKHSTQLNEESFFIKNPEQANFGMKQAKDAFNRSISLFR